MRLYYQINYTLTEVPEDEAYFHAQFRRSNPTQGSLHTLIDGVKGKGQYVGTQMLQKTHAGTGFMHESFHKDDPKKFTRSWFAWANTLFGELLWKTFNEKPYLLEY